MKYCVIADENTVSGFSLLGVDGTVVAVGSPQAEAQACEAFERAVSDPLLGALIISGPVASLIGSRIAEHKQSGRFPQVIGIGEDVC